MDDDGWSSGLSNCNLALIRNSRLAILITDTVVCGGGSMRSFLLIVLVGLLVARLACAADVGSVRLATLEYPPYVTETAQGAQGATVEIVKTAFARIGINTDIAFYPIARGQYLVQAGEVDGFFSIKRTPEREKSLRFSSNPLMSQDYVFFVRRGASVVFDGGWVSVRNATIGVVVATSYGQRFDQAARDGSLPRLDPATNHEMSFRKLLAGRIDLVVCSRWVGIHYLRKLRALQEVTTTGPPIETTQSYLAFSRKASLGDIPQRFDEALGAMLADGTVARLLDEHLGPISEGIPVLQH